jgi:phosphoribosylanthranilate isomerase
MIAGRDHRVKILKTFKVKDKIMGTEPENYSDADHYLFDTYHPKMMGGTGIKFDWDVLKGRNFGRPVFLAGGLDPVNVREAVISLRPYAVDVSSGIESSQGKKDVKKVKEFIHNAKTA